MPTLRLVRPRSGPLADRWEVTWDAAAPDVETWERASGREETDRRRFADRRDLVRYVAVAVLRRRLAGWRESPRSAWPLAETGIPPTGPARALAFTQQLVDAGHPFGAFARGALDDGVRERVHRTVFDEWAPDRVGAAWDGAFVRHVHLHPEGRDFPALLAELLAHPALRCLETLSLATGALTVRSAPSASPLAWTDLVAALAAADVPPTVSALRLRGTHGALDLAPLVDRMAHLVDLEVVGPIPVDEAVRAAAAVAGSLRRLRVTGVAAEGAVPIEVLRELRLVWLEPWPDGVAREGLAIEPWRCAVPLGGQVDWDGVVADAPDLEDDEDDDEDDEDDGAAASDASGDGSGSGPSGDPDPELERYGPWETRLWEVELDDVRGGLSPDEAFLRIRSWEPPSPADAEDAPDVPADGWWLDAYGRCCSTEGT